MHLVAQATRNQILALTAQIGAAAGTTTGDGTSPTGLIIPSWVCAMKAIEQSYMMGVYECVQ